MMRFYVASFVFFILGCGSIIGAIWARFHRDRDHFYRRNQFGVMSFENYGAYLKFKAKSDLLEVLGKFGIYLGLFFLFGTFVFGFNMPHD